MKKIREKRDRGLRNVVKGWELERLAREKFSVTKCMKTSKMRVNILSSTINI